MPLPLTVSCFGKIQYRLTRVVPEKGPLNGCVCIYDGVTKQNCNIQVWPCLSRDTVYIRWIACVLGQGGSVELYRATVARCSDHVVKTRSSPLQSASHLVSLPERPRTRVSHSPQLQLGQVCNCSKWLNGGSTDSTLWRILKLTHDHNFGHGLRLGLKGMIMVSQSKKVKVKFSHTRYRALGPELIPVYRQSARRWHEVNHAIDPAVGCRYFLPGLRLPP